MLKLGKFCMGSTVLQTTLEQSTKGVDNASPTRFTRLTIRSFGGASVANFIRKNLATYPGPGGQPHARDVMAPPEYCWDISMQNHHGHPDQNPGHSASAEMGEVDTDSGTAHPQAGVEAGNQLAAAIEENAASRSRGSGSMALANALPPGRRPVVSPSRASERTVVITDAHGELRASKALLRLIREAVLFIYPAMTRDDSYTAEELLGPDIWDPRSPGGRRFIGRCLAWMERNRLIPIRRVTPIGKYPVRYSK